MKYLFYTLIIGGGMLTAQAQQLNLVDEKPNEIKINATNLIFGGWLDVAYEKIISEESSFGVSTLINLDLVDGSEEYRTFSFTPYYRQYFSPLNGEGWYVEGFMMLNTARVLPENADLIGGNFTPEKENNFNLALGFSVGGKIVSQNGFVLDMYLGLGRNIIRNTVDLDLVGRGGVALGYRF